VAAGPDSASFEKPAEAYDRFVGRYGRALGEATVERVALDAGSRVLDVGCGPGQLTAVLAELLGAGDVSAVDPSESFARACRERVPGADVRVAGAEELPFEDDSFDAVLSQLVVNFIPDAPAGVREMRRVTRLGGTVAATVWDYTGEMTMLRAFWDAALEVDPDGAGPLDEGRRMAHHKPGPLAELWSDAGLAEVETDSIVVSVAYEDFNDLWVPFTAGIGPAGAYCASLSPDDRERLRAAYHRNVGSPEAPFELSARAWLVRGTEAAG
jgi:SAM-dependent methyltransferase